MVVLQEYVGEVGITFQCQVSSRCILKIIKIAWLELFKNKKGSYVRRHFKAQCISVVLFFCVGHFDDVVQCTCIAFSLQCFDTVDLDDDLKKLYMS